MNNTVVITFDDEAYAYKAGFFVEGELVTSKRLTDVEEENLSSYLGKESQHIPFEDILKERQEFWWMNSTDGTATNFDEIMDLIIKEVNDGLLRNS
jgi:hypothetical protein